MVHGEEIRCWLAPVVEHWRNPSICVLVGLFVLERGDGFLKKLVGHCNVSLFSWDMKGRLKPVIPVCLQRKWADRKIRGRRRKTLKKNARKKELMESIEKKKDKEKHRYKKEKHRDKKDKESDPNKDKHKAGAFFPDEERVVVLPDVHLHRFREKRNVWEKDVNVSLGEKSVAGQSIFSNGESFPKISHPAAHTKIIKNDPEFTKRNTDEERRTNSQFPNTNEEREKDGMVKITGICAMTVVDGKEKTNKSSVLKKDVVGVTGEAKFSRSALGQNVVRPYKLPGKCPGPVVDGRERKEKQTIDEMIDGRPVSGEARSSVVHCLRLLLELFQIELELCSCPWRRSLSRCCRGEKFGGESMVKKGEKRKGEDGGKSIYEDNIKRKRR